MNLPKATKNYGEQDQDNMRAVIARADAQNMKKNTDIEMGRARIFLKSPNGSRWVLTVDDAGALSAVAA